MFQGHPFMERLRENKFLMYAILASSAVVVALSLGLSDDLSNTFEIVEFPDDVSVSVDSAIRKILINLF